MGSLARVVTLFWTEYPPPGVFPMAYKASFNSDELAHNLEQPSYRFCNVIK